MVRKSVLQNVAWVKRFNERSSYTDSKSYVRLARSRRVRYSKSTVVHPHFSERLLGITTKVDSPEGSQPLLTPPAKLTDGTPILLSSSFFVISGSIGLEL